MTRHCYSTPCGYYSGGCLSCSGCWCDMAVDRVCLWCNGPILSTNTRAIYCSTQHKKNAASKRHRERNPGYFKKYANCPRAIKYRKDNAELLKHKSREYRRVHGESPHAPAWRSANRDRLRLNERNRRARKQNNVGSVGVQYADWVKLCRRYGNRCAYCGTRPTTEPLHMDHVIPVSKGGRHAIGNILPACKACNKSKAARLLAEWRIRERGGDATWLLGTQAI